MTRQEAIKRISELSCYYQHVRMTDCPLCAAEVESLVTILMASAVKEEEEAQEKADNSQFGLGA